jgi:hypothetical protein
VEAVQIITADGPSRNGQSVFIRLYSFCWRWNGVSVIKGIYENVTMPSSKNLKLVLARRCKVVCCQTITSVEQKGSEW